MEMPRGVVEAALTIVTFIYFNMGTCTTRSVLTRSHEPLTSKLVTHSLCELTLPRCRTLTTRRPRPGRLSMVLCHLTRYRCRIGSCGTTVSAYGQFVREFPSSNRLLGIRLACTLSLSTIKGGGSTTPVCRTVTTGSTTSCRLELGTCCFTNRTRFHRNSCGATVSEFRTLASLTSKGGLSTSLHSLYNFTGLCVTSVASHSGATTTIGSRLTVCSRLREKRLSPEVSTRTFFGDTALLCASNGCGRSHRQCGTLLTHFPSSVEMISTVLPTT